MRALSIAQARPVRHVRAVGRRVRTTQITRFGRNQAVRLIDHIGGNARGALRVSVTSRDQPDVTEGREQTAVRGPDREVARQ